jgi:hypothetical protein
MLKIIPTITIENLIKKEDYENFRGNFFLKIIAPPYSNDSDDKWFLPVKDLGGIGLANVAIHRTPPDWVGYDRTQAYLLKMFFEERDFYENLCRVGDTVLVQAYPKKDREGKIFLNVPDFLILSPHFYIGIREITGSLFCKREAYLRYNKKVSLKWLHNFEPSSLRGSLVHRVLAHLAEDGKFPLSNSKRETWEYLEKVIDDVSLDTIALSGLIGGEPGQLLNNVIKHIETILSDKEIHKFLSKYKWKSEALLPSPGLFGIPDLISDNIIIDFKSSKPRKFFDLQKQERQLRAYLIGMTFLYGLDEVIDNFNGYLLYTDPYLSSDEKLNKVDFKVEFFNDFLIARNGLLSTKIRRYIPEIPDDCSMCGFSINIDEKLTKYPPCQFYCQIERYWPCYEEIDGKLNICPLMEQCEMYDQYFPVDELDGVNKLRILLQEERAEQEEKLNLITSLNKNEIEKICERFNNLIIKAVSKKGEIVLQKENFLFEGIFLPGDEISIFSPEGDPLEDGIVKVVNDKYIAISGTSNRIRNLKDNKVDIIRKGTGEHIIHWCLHTLDLLQRNDKTSLLHFGEWSNEKLMPPEEILTNLDDIPDSKTDILVFHPSRTPKDNFLSKLIKKMPKPGLMLVDNWNIPSLPNNIKYCKYGEGIIRSEKLLYIVNDRENEFKNCDLFICLYSQIWDESFPFLEKDLFKTLILLNGEKISAITYSKLRNFAPKRFLIGDPNLSTSKGITKKAREVGLFGGFLERAFVVFNFGIPRAFKDFASLLIKENWYPENLSEYFKNLGKSFTDYKKSSIKIDFKEIEGSAEDILPSNFEISIKKDLNLGSKYELILETNETFDISNLKREFANCPETCITKIINNEDIKEGKIVKFPGINIPFKYIGLKRLTPGIDMKVSDNIKILFNSKHINYFKGKGLINKDEVKAIIHYIKEHPMDLAIVATTEGQVNLLKEELLKSIYKDIPVWLVDRLPINEYGTILLSLVWTENQDVIPESLEDPGIIYRFLLSPRNKLILFGSSEIKERLGFNFS